jgi:predicted TIM-barrel fold metal-dependent hydrolase
VVDPDRAMGDIQDLNFRAEPLRKILRDNALRVFNIKS